MASLVADYGTSSGSDDDNDSVKDEKDSDNLPPETAAGNFFTGNIDDVGSSESEEETSESSDSQKLPDPLSKQERLPNPLLQEKLPPPTFSKKMKHGKVAEGSVFQNQYYNEEMTKHSILEQHVKMTSAEIQSESGKKICWNFRKGKCRFGHKCKYSHGMEIASAGAEMAQMNNAQYGESSWQGEAEEIEEVDPDETNPMVDLKRKMRSGINDKLVPPKKAMKAYKKQQRQENPWTA